MLAHVIGQPECVLAHELLREIGIARLDGRDDVHVLVQGTLRARLSCPIVTLRMPAHTVDEEIVGHVE